MPAESPHIVEGEIFIASIKIIATAYLRMEVDFVVIFTDMGCH